jgi:hypothetical protein
MDTWRKDMIDSSPAELALNMHRRKRSARTIMRTLYRAWARFDEDDVQHAERLLCDVERQVILDGRTAA